MNSKVPKQCSKYLKSWHSGYKAYTCQKSLRFTHSDSGWQRGRWAQFWCRWSWDQLWEIWSESIHLRAFWVYTFSFSQTSISSIFKLLFSHSIYFWLVFWKGITCIKKVIICLKVRFSPSLTPSFRSRSNTSSKPLRHPFTDF